MSGHQIKDNVVLVTGANRGIGKALVEASLTRGAARVYAGTRRIGALQDLQATYGPRLVPILLDVTDLPQVAAVAAAARDVSILVNNAGLASAALGASLTDPAILKSARAEMEVNYFGPLYLLQAFAPILARNGGGAIVNIASVVGLSSFPPFASYSASKAAVRSLTQSARVQLAGQGTQVFGVYPGPVDTDMAADLQLDKASPALVATAVLDAIEAGTLEVFPDPFAKEFGQRFEASPIGLEQHVTEMVSGAAA